MRITHIDQLLPHIEGRREFFVAERPGYKIIDYHFTVEDSFDEPARRECRGIKFRTDGTILARPLHKFFNIGERPETRPEAIDLRRPHVVLDKLDGSMVHACVLEDRVVFMTRMGHTDQAKHAESLLTAELAERCRALLEAGKTPVFEFTSPDNQIVVPYTVAALTLLAVRDTVEGTYATRTETAAHAAALGVDVVAMVPSTWTDTIAFLDHVRALQGQEGFVLRFDDGHGGGMWMKAKAADYVLKHRVLSDAALEKNTLALILMGRIDDVLPLLKGEHRAGVERYLRDVRTGILASAAEVEALVKSGAHLDQKAFAVEHLKGVRDDLRACAFLVRRGHDAVATVEEFILKNTGTQPNVDRIRPIFNAAWQVKAVKLEG
jgi:RNA ligase